MANYAYAHFKKSITSNECERWLKYLNTNRFNNKLKITREKDYFDVSVLNEDGKETWDIMSFFLEGKKTLNHKHCHNFHLGELIFEQMAYLMGATHITDEGIEDKLSPVYHLRNGVAYEKRFTDFMTYKKSDVFNKENDFVHPYHQKIIKGGSKDKQKLIKNIDHSGRDVWYGDALRLSIALEQYELAAGLIQAGWKAENNPDFTSIPIPGHIREEYLKKIHPPLFNMLLTSVTLNNLEKERLTEKKEQIKTLIDLLLQKGIALNMKDCRGMTAINCLENNYAISKSDRQDLISFIENKMIAMNLNDPTLNKPMKI